MPHRNEAVLASLQTCCVLFHPGAFTIPFALESCMASLTPLSVLQGHFSGSVPEVRQLCCSFLRPQFSSVQSLSHVKLFATPWTTALQASLSITDSWSLLKVMSIESVMPSNHLILCRPLLLLPSIFPSIRVFSNESVLHKGAKVLEFQLQRQSFQ